MSATLSRPSGATRLNPSIDEMARDARTLAGSEPRAWAAKFRALLACYGWQVERQGPVYYVPVGPPRGVMRIETVLEDWIITRKEKAA